MNFSKYIIPIFLTLIMLTALIKRKNAFSAFGCGVKNSLKTGIEIFPNIMAVMCAAAMFNASGAADIFARILFPVLKIFSVPSELSLLALLRPISGSGSIAVSENILNTYGADSFVSKTACIIMASTETSLYTAAVYFSVTKVKDMRHTVICALAADFFCIVFSCFISNIFFG